MNDPTIQRIADAARKLLHQDGAAGVTMRKVAAAVGVTPMSLYRHYPDRDGLLKALADTGFVELTARLTALRLNGPIDRQLIKLLDVFLDYGLEHPRLFELMFFTRHEGARKYPEDFKARRSPTANFAADVIARAMQDGTLRKHDPWEIAFEIGAFMQGHMMLFLGGRISMSESEFRAFFHRSVRRYLNGILK